MIAAVALLLVGAAVAGVVLLSSGGQAFRRIQPQGVPYTLEVPEDWAEWTHHAGSSTVTVLSPSDLSGLFGDDPEAFSAAAAAAAERPDEVVGMAIYHEPVLDGSTSDQQLPDAQALLPGSGAADLVTGGRIEAGDLQANRMTGTLVLGDGASLELAVYVVESAPRQMLVFFAPPSVLADHADAFDHVVASLQSTA